MTDKSYSRTLLIRALLFVLLILSSTRGVPSNNVQAQTPLSTTHTLKGRVVDSDHSPVVGATVQAITATSTGEAVTDDQGYYSLVVTSAGTLSITGKNLVAKQLTFGEIDQTVDATIEYLVPPVHDTVVIRAESTEPHINRQDETLYKEGFPSRDDQLLFQFGSGINAGQHEGGGKSLEIRRFGFNLDHGGVGPGLLVKVDNFDQNQASQGHGQGYLGQLKSLSSELIDEVQILNGPFSAQYGNFSGLGVVQVSLKESLAQTALIRLQGGSFNTKRAFLAISPANGFIAYELARTDTPFHKPYDRDNITGSYKFLLKPGRELAFKFNFGRNDFFSSGQIPLDLIQSRELDRFGAIDDTGGGRVRTFNAGVLFKQNYNDGASLKLDGLIARSLFDLYSNFTFFLENPQLGDQINQHDSRLQQGANLQYLKPYTLGKYRALVTTGGSYLGNEILVTLNKTFKRDPYLNVTYVNANIATYSSYIQNDLDFGKLHLDLGLRYDLFYFGTKDRNAPMFTGTNTKSEAQPKVGVVYHLFNTLPLNLYFNYGRGVTSQDARGIAQRPDGPKVSTTDFYQTGFAFNQRHFSLIGTGFLIDQSSTQVYISDDNTIEFQGPSRSYGYELKGSARLNRYISFNASGTKVINAFFRGTSPREFLSNAPSLTLNANLILSDLAGISGLLSYRHINSYILDSINTSIRASGLDVVDVKFSKKLVKGFEVSLGIDNLLNKRFFEVQNFGDSRAHPGDDIVSRIHGTSGYPFSLNLGVTFRFGQR